MNEDLALWLAGCFVLFFIGVYGLITKKDGVKILISIEIMVMAANSIFLGIGYLTNSLVDPLSQTYTILSLGVGGSIVGVGLAFITATFRKCGTADLTANILLRW